jgi:hypothetical protein
LTFGDNGRNGSFTFPTSYPDDGYVLTPANPKKVLLMAVLNPITGNQDFHIIVYKADATIDESFGNGAV